MKISYLQFCVLLLQFAQCHQEESNRLLGPVSLEDHLIDVPLLQLLTDVDRLLQLCHLKQSLGQVEFVLEFLAAGSGWWLLCTMAKRDAYLVKPLQLKVVVAMRKVANGGVDAETLFEIVNQLWQNGERNFRSICHRGTIKPVRDLTKSEIDGDEKTNEDREKEM